MLTMGLLFMMLFLLSISSPTPWTLLATVLLEQQVSSFDGLLPDCQAAFERDAADQHGDDDVDDGNKNNSSWSGLRLLPAHHVRTLFCGASWRGLCHATQHHIVLTICGPSSSLLFFLLGGGSCTMMTTVLPTMCCRNDVPAVVMCCLLVFLLVICCCSCLYSFLTDLGCVVVHYNDDLGCVVILLITTTMILVVLSCWSWLWHYNCNE